MPYASTKTRAPWLVFGRMNWFFRAIEAQDGTWYCRRGLTVFDEHPTLGETLTHLRELAQPHAPASLFAHWQDGRVEPMDEIDAPASS